MLLKAAQWQSQRELSPGYSRSWIKWFLCGNPRRQGKPAIRLAAEAVEAFWSEPANRAGRIRPLVAASVGPYGAYLADGSEYDGRYGVGDEVLIRTARRIRDSVRSDAVVVRWGGEEFLVVDRIPAAQAAGVAERIRTAVSAPARPVVTASIGLATCTRPGSDLAEVITAADVAMYQAKARGGDRVAIAADLC